MKMEKMLLIFFLLAGVELSQCRREKLVSLDTAVVEFQTSTNENLQFYGSSTGGDWGIKLTENAKGEFVDVVAARKLFNSTDNLACHNESTVMVEKTDVFYLFIDRGVCPFSQKVFNAQRAGASGVIIGGTFESIYKSFNDNKKKTAKQQKIDEEMALNCLQGTAPAPKLSPSVNPWDVKYSVPACSSSCPSKRCLPSRSKPNVCCVWDVKDTMGFNSLNGSISLSSVSKMKIVRLSANDADIVRNKLSNLKASMLSLFRIDSTSWLCICRFYKRKVPKVDLSSFLVWGMATLTVILAGYMSSSLERRKAIFLSSNVEATEESIQTLRDEEIELHETTLQLTVWHGVFFVIFGSAFLLILFYLNVVMVVIVLFAIGAASATSQLLFSPFFRSILPATINKTSKPLPWDLGTVSVSDILSGIVGVSLAILWVLHRHFYYAFVLQDIFGVCVCLVFLNVIRLPNIKIATVLLVLVFIYDIFFVFISPLIFEDSVMIKAAKGGNQGSADVSDGYCLRYPENTYHNCRREDIPILLRLPKIFDWQGGQVMLGLGDIVLPGVLVVFCARFDYLTRGNLLGKKVCEKEGFCRGIFGYFVWMCIGYAVGLFCANLGVILMEQGQPALLYLVPSTLGLLVLLSFYNHSFSNLWHGPKQFSEQDHHDKIETPI